MNFFIYFVVGSEKHRKKTIPPKTYNKTNNHTFIAAPLGSIPDLPALSCREIKASEGKDTVSGKYWLDPTGSGKVAFVYCDMINEGKRQSVNK